MSSDQRHLLAGIFLFLVFHFCRCCCLPQQRHWFIRGRGPWAAISSFPSALWLPDNIQLSLMCHRGPTVRLSAPLFYCGGSVRRKKRGSRLPAQLRAVTRTPHTKRHPLRRLPEWEATLLIPQFVTGEQVQRAKWKDNKREPHFFPPFSLTWCK